MRIILFASAALASALALAGCNNSSGLASVTSAICADAAVVQSSTLELNKSQKLALNGIIASCATTAGGTSFSQASVALTIINDAIMLQSSGLLTNVKLKAMAPDQALKMERIQDKWEAAARANGFK